MVTKYDEICVLKKIICSYAESKKRNFNIVVDKIKESSSGISMDITNKESKDKIKMFQNDFNILSTFYKQYESATVIIDELNKILMLYEQEYTENERKPGGKAEQNKAEANRLFSNLKNSNYEYKDIMNEISSNLYKNGDSNLVGIEKGIDSKITDLENDYKQGKITKEQLIFYTFMTITLLENNDISIEIAEKKHN